MEQLNLDIISIYAYADVAHARERELWRGFLSYALPVVMSLRGDVIEHCLAESIVYHVHELTARGGEEVDVHESLRCISVLLAKEIGVSPEFAVASFFEGDVPTKLHRMRSGRVKVRRQIKNEDATIARWLTHLVKIQADNHFLNKVEKWKTWLYPIQQAKSG